MQSNLTTKVKYSETSNQIPEMLREGIQEGYIWCFVPAPLTWLVRRPYVAPVQCHDCFGKKGGLIYMGGSPRGKNEFPFDQRGQQACRKIM